MTSLGSAYCHVSLLGKRWGRRIRKTGDNSLRKGRATQERAKYKILATGNIFCPGAQAGNVQVEGGVPAPGVPVSRPGRREGRRGLRSQKAWTGSHKTFLQTPRRNIPTGCPRRSESVFANPGESQKEHFPKEGRERGGKTTYVFVTDGLFPSKLVARNPEQTRFLSTNTHRRAILPPQPPPHLP